MEACFIGLVSPCGLATNFCSFIYIHKYLKITPHILKLLKIESVYSFVLGLIHCLGFFRIVLGATLSFTSCSMALDPLPSMFVVSTLISAMISVIRYYMASSTGDNRLVDHIKIENRSNVACLSLICATTVTIFYNVKFQIPVTPVVYECAELKYPWPYVPSPGICILVMTSCSLYYDISLIKFIQLQNKVQQVQMVAWVCSNN
jgi:hypothetical protein